MTLDDTTKQLERLIETYEPSPETIQVVREVTFLQLVGVSGAGKGTIAQILLKTGDYRYVVSHTTRPPRTNHGIMEVDGADYHFIDMQTAQNMLQDKSFVEAKWYSGNIYGTSREEFELAAKENKTAITDIDIQGAEEYLEFSENVLPIFLLPPDYDTWLNRLYGRYADMLESHQQDIQKRLATSRIELERALNDPRLQPVINLDSAKTAERIEELLRGKALTDSERLHAVEVMQHLLDHLHD